MAHVDRDETSDKPGLGAWTLSRRVQAPGTNAGAESIAFQNWRHFKEAFAPEVVDRAVRDSELPVSRILDPFGGSGTTSLAAQFLGIVPTTTEVNPFLADLIEAKLTGYDLGAVSRHLRRVAETSGSAVEADLGHLPPTFVEPGVKDRWLFSRDYVASFRRLLGSIEAIEDIAVGRLLKVLLGGVLLETSNTRVSGKGRRYRGSWATRQTSGDELVKAFASRASAALADLEKFGERKEMGFEIHRGDSRLIEYKAEAFELSVFSPPYPNSFDYTDVYNIELWMLGYLNTSEQNGTLRKATLTSHVQVSREFAARPAGSALLDEAVALLTEKRESLWDSRLPDMVGAYFADLLDVVDKVGSALCPRGEMWMIVGDSRYAGVDVKVAEILTQLVESVGFDFIGAEAARSMRASPQQGGAEILPETLLRFRRPSVNV